MEDQRVDCSFSVFCFLLEQSKRVRLWRTQMHFSFTGKKASFSTGYRGGIQKYPTDNIIPQSGMPYLCPDCMFVMATVISVTVYPFHLWSFSLCNILFLLALFVLVRPWKSWRRGGWEWGGISISILCPYQRVKSIIDIIFSPL